MIQDGKEERSVSHVNHYVSTDKHNVSNDELQLVLDDELIWRNCLLLVRYPHAPRQLNTISVEKNDTTGNATKTTWQRQAVENTTDSFPEVYCLRTSHADWDESLLWNTYTMLTVCGTSIGFSRLGHRPGRPAGGEVFPDGLPPAALRCERYRGSGRRP